MLPSSVVCGLHWPRSVWAPLRVALLRTASAQPRCITPSAVLEPKSREGLPVTVAIKPSKVSSVRSVGTAAVAVSKDVTSGPYKAAGWWRAVASSKGWGYSLWLCLHTCEVVITGFRDI